MFIKEANIQITEGCIRRVIPVYNNSFFMQIINLFRVSQKLPARGVTSYRHVDIDNNVINEYKINNEDDGFLAISEYEIMIPDPKNGQIFVINLMKNTEQKIPYNFKHNISQLQIFFFHQSQKILIKQSYQKSLYIDKRKDYNWGNLKHRQIDLTYFNRDNLSQTEPYFNYKIENSTLIKNMQNYSDNISQGNNHSLVIFRQLDANFNFMLVDLCSDQKGNIERRKRKVILPVENIGYMQFKFWESMKNYLVFACPQKGLNYIGYISLQNNEIIKLECDNKQHQSVSLQFLQKCIVVGKIRVTRTVKKDSNTAEIHIFDIETNKIVQSKSFQVQKSVGEIKLDRYDFNPSLLVLSTFEYLSQRGIIRLMKFQRDKDIYMHMLLHINEDFDDDLLQDSIELLV